VENGRIANGHECDKKQPKTPAEPLQMLPDRHKSLGGETPNGKGHPPEKVYQWEMGGNWKSGKRKKGGLKIPGKLTLRYAGGGAKNL